MSNVWVCALCEQVIPRGVIIYRLRCIGRCQLLYHIRCLGMPKEDYFQLKSNGGSWYCGRCEEPGYLEEPEEEGEDEEDAPQVDVLTVNSVDLCIRENGKRHHTDRFDLMRREKASVGLAAKLIIRRGQTFRLRLNCSRPFKRNIDAISFIFTVDDPKGKPNYGNGTLVGAALKGHPNELSVEPNEWSAAIDSIQGDLLEVVIKSSATAPVTTWKLDIDTKLYTGGAKSYSLPQSFYLLFNPWCESDSVYMEDTHLLDEYIHGDTTLIWRGSYNRLRPSVWKLGQYERDILDAAMAVVAGPGKVSAGFRGDPIKVTRCLSAAVNSIDDDGVVYGNWGDDFAGGIAPTKWVGSVEILQKYYKTMKPVKYGQCWVFAGVLATICRALGIPNRIITNYSSAHDTHSSLTLDYFVSNEGNVMEEMNTDSIWNYHVWNEVWMDRPDLGIGAMGGYGGWQAVDATPQEESDGMYRVGPASVLAVKFGEVRMPHDCDFLYSEVNADKVFWKYAGPANPIKLLRKDELSIGHFISTKAVGRWEREDVTNNYKFDEKSNEERATMLKALKQSNNVFARYYLNEEFNDIYFDFELLDDIKIGQPFQVILQIRNRSTEKSHRINGSLHVDTVHYTGRQREQVKFTHFGVEVEPNGVERCLLDVSFDEYFKHLHDQSAFNIACMAKVEGTEYDYFAEDDFRVRKPDIKFQFGAQPKSKQPVEVMVRVENSLPIPLRKGLFQIEGPGIEKPITAKLAEVPVGGSAEYQFEFIPPYAGRATLVAKFFSKEMDDVDGFVAFETLPKDEDIITNGNGTTELSNEVVSRDDVEE